MLFQTKSQKVPILRKQAVVAAIGSIKLEGLEPSRQTLRLLEDYTKGKITVKQLRDKVLAGQKKRP